MSNTLPILLTATFSAVGAWYATTPRRRLRSRQDLINSLHPKVLQGLSHYLSGSVSSMDDAEFWNASERLDGMLARWHNAKILVQIVQAEVRDGRIPDVELPYLRGHSWLIALLLLSSIAEAALRRAIPDTPHACARMIAGLYGEVQDRARNICVDYVPDILNQLDALL